MPKHKRTQNPKTFANYRSYKPFLRIEFFYNCVYCNASEPEIGGPSRTHIDHYRPKEKFPKLKNIYTNLFYSCPECNQSKGDYWPSSLQRLGKQFILNICDHDIEKHVDKSLPKWTGKTAAGKWNIIALKLCSPAQILRREDRIEHLDLVKEKKVQLASAKKALATAVHIQDKNAQAILQQQIPKIQRQIDSILRKIEGQP